MLTGIEQANALVVGATQGIGLGFVESLLENPKVGRVFGTFRKPLTADRLFDLKRKYPDRLECLQLDVTDEAQIASALEKVQESAKELHLAVYCVGVLHENDLAPEKSLRDVCAENLLRSFQVNSVGAVLVAKHLVPLLKGSERAVFACISAKVGSIEDNRLGGWYGYRASKAALNMFVRTTAVEYRLRCPKTIVVALHPGTTDTRLSEPFQNNVPPAQLFSVEQTVGLLLGVLNKLEMSDSGEFYSWNGARLPW